MKGISVTAWGVYSVWHRHARVYQKTWYTTKYQYFQPLIPLKLLTRYSTPVLRAYPLVKKIIF